MNEIDTTEGKAGRPGVRSLGRWILSAWDALDIAIPVLLGTAVFSVLMIVVPAELISELYAVGRYWMATALAFVCVATVFAVVRDLRRRQMSLTSFVVGAAWLTCVGWVVISLGF